MLGPSSPTQKSKPEPTSPASSASSSDWVRGDRGNNPGNNDVWPWGQKSEISRLSVVFQKLKKIIEF